MRKALLAAGVILLVPGLAACGDLESTTSTDSASAATPEPTATATATPKPSVSLSVPDTRTVRRDDVTLRGSVEPANAKVRVHGESVKVDRDGDWEYHATLSHQGETTYKVQASAPGHYAHTEFASFDRELNAEEQAAADAAEAAAFKSEAQTIDFDQLNKNPYAYAGQKVKYTGQIFQIQDTGYGGMMLLAVTDMGYDIWDDNVWVSYDTSFQSAEDDVVTIYGVVRGAKSYDTAIGGSMTVPKIKMRYIEE